MTDPQSTQLSRSASIRTPKVEPKNRMMRPVDCEHPADANRPPDWPDKRAMARPRSTAVICARLLPRISHSTMCTWTNTTNIGALDAATAAARKAASIDIFVNRIQTWPISWAAVIASAKPNETWPNRLSQSSWPTAQWMLVMRQVIRQFWIRTRPA